MRIKIEGPVTRERLLDVLLDVLTRADGEAYLTGVSLYGTLRNERGERVDLLDDDGETIETLVYPEVRNQIPANRPARQKPTLRVVASNPTSGVF